VKTLSGALVLGVILAVATLLCLAPVPASLLPPEAENVSPRHLDRNGEILSMTYENRWNVHDRVSLHETPDLLKRAFIVAEDQRFYRHGGVDWLARMNAAVENLSSLRVVRGASTITEQVVRMIHPRPRTLWSRWLEGFEARRLESRFSKDEILEFYLNQVPYARNRRGVRQAAREYFDRDLDTLNARETLALAVLVRSPSRLDLHKSTEPIAKGIENLAGRLGIDLDLEGSLQVEASNLDVDAAHFLRSIPRDSAIADAPGVVVTTLDASLQRRIRGLLDRQLDSLEGRDVQDGAVLVVNHETDEILAWVNGRGFEQEEGGQIDMITTPRQPGSTMKPFVYALALERGWTAATILEDEPIAEAVGSGLHRFRNYSRHYYGPLRLREALGNSLNVPAIKAIQFAGRSDFLELLGRLGVRSLDQHPDYYGDGLALGNGEITLFELVSAYSVLARGGVYRPFVWSRSEPHRNEATRVLSVETASILADILSDPEARALEFGRSSVLNLPVQTAAKTGTSNDYRDAWVVGFSHRYTVGVWLGNLDRRPMREVTGSVGPALVLRSIFADLHRNEESRPLYLSRRLRQVRVCRASGKLAGDSCPVATEWFRPETVPEESCPLHGTGAARSLSPRVGEIRIAQPSPGLNLALDPRIPDELERFSLEVEGLPSASRVEWWVDEELFAESTADRGRSLWPLTRGRHVARARVWVAAGGDPKWTDPVGFRVR
jgi:penicillin-binding protein 1C